MHLILLVKELVSGMPKIVLQFIKEEDGLMLYAPVDMDDEEALGNRKIIGAELLGNKATMTVLQRKSLHLYCTKLANALNEAGYDMVATMEVLSKKGKIPWSMLAVKERLWKVVQKDTFKKESTNDQYTNEVSVVYEALNEVTSTNLGVSIPFPDRYSQMQEQIGIK